MKLFVVTVPQSTLTSSVRSQESGVFRVIGLDDESVLKYVTNSFITLNHYREDFDPITRFKIVETQT